MTTIQEIIPVSFLFLDMRMREEIYKPYSYVGEKKAVSPLKRKKMCVHTLELPANVYQRRKHPPFVMVNHHYNLI